MLGRMGWGLGLGVLLGLSHGPSAIAFSQGDVEHLSRTRNCPGCALDAADLRRDFLQEADRRDANLRGANLSGATITGTDLAGADLQGANLAGAIFQDVNLADANLRDADITGWQAMNTNLCEAVLSDGEVGPCPRPVRR